MDLTILGNHKLKIAIQANRVSFPAQVPVYQKQSRADIQWRLAVLYFVRGWTLKKIAERYKVSRERADQIIKAWRIVSVRRGYIQEVHPPASSGHGNRLDAMSQAINEPHVIPDSIAVGGWTGSI